MALTTVTEASISYLGLSINIHKMLQVKLMIEENKKLFFPRISRKKVQTKRQPNNGLLMYFYVIYRAR